MALSDVGSAQTARTSLHDTAIVDEGEEETRRVGIAVDDTHGAHGQLQHANAGTDDGNGDDGAGDGHIDGNGDAGGAHRW